MSPMSQSSSSPASAMSPARNSRQRKKFCVCKAYFDEETQYGDISCDLCQQPFHSICVQDPADPIEPGSEFTYTCEPCQQKHTSARSTCVCHSSNEHHSSWISCDICQTWYHQKCVQDKIRPHPSGSAIDPEFICNKCTRTDLNMLTCPLSAREWQIVKHIFLRMKNSKHIWPIKRFDLTETIGANLAAIEQKIQQESYPHFKAFMDEMIFTITTYREHFSTTADSLYTNSHGISNTTEIKCCEIVEYEFSNCIRSYISNDREPTHLNSQVLQKRLPSIQQNELRIQQGLASSSN
jgi:hypothetical protein